jgi:integrase/recombinase XerD
VPVEPIERYLAFLTDVDRSPNTVKAYAHDLKDWFVFLAGRGLDWREVRLEDVGEFVAWLRLPPSARDGRIAVLPSVVAHCGGATANRKLSAVSAFYQHAARHGVDLGELLRSWQPAGRRGTSWRPFLHHISKTQPAARRLIALKVPRKHPRILSAVEVQAVLDSCDRLRDRLLFAVGTPTSGCRWPGARPGRAGRRGWLADRAGQATLSSGGRRVGGASGGSWPG